MRIQDPELHLGMHRPVECIEARADGGPGVVVLGQFVGGGYFITRYTDGGTPIRTTRWSTPDRNRALEIFWSWVAS